MTRIIGDFRVGLPRPDALEACTEAIQRLGWEIESVQEDRIVAHARTTSGGRAPKVDLELVSAGMSTRLQIAGADTEADPLSEGAVIAALDRLRDEINASASRFAAAKSAPAKPAAGPAARRTPTARRPPADRQRLMAALGGLAILAALAVGAWLLFTGDGDDASAPERTARQGAAAGQDGEKSQSNASGRGSGDRASSRSGQQSEGTESSGGKTASGGTGNSDAARACAQQVGDLLSELKNLQVDAGGLGASAYSQRVKVLRSTADRTNFNQLDSVCLFKVAFFLQDAVGSFVAAEKAMTKCSADSNCDPESIESKLEGHWDTASVSIRKANRALEALS